MVSVWSIVKPKYRLEVVKRKKWFYRIVSIRNGETVMVSETFYSKWNAKRQALKLLKENNYEYKEIK